jgi:hypothetical protein
MSMIRLHNMLFTSVDSNDHPHVTSTLSSSSSFFHLPNIYIVSVFVCINLAYQLSIYLLIDHILDILILN